MADYEISVRGDHVRMDVTTDWTPGREAQEIAEAWTQVTQTCRDSKLDRVLAVFHMTGSIPVVTAYEVASDPTAFGWKHRYKGALVYLDDKRYESNKFTETVAVNRSFKIRAFREEQEALQWLLQS